MLDVPHNGDGCGGQGGRCPHNAFLVGRNKVDNTSKVLVVPVFCIYFCSLAGRPLAALP